MDKLHCARCDTELDDDVHAVCGHCEADLRNEERRQLGERTRRHARMILTAATHHRFQGRRGWALIRSRGVHTDLVLRSGTWWCGPAAIDRPSAAALLRGILFDKLVAEAIDDHCKKTCPL